MNKNKIFFAQVGEVKPTTNNDFEKGTFKMYKGLGVFNIIAVNPNKAELSQIYGREIDKEPTYVFENDKGKQVAITFYFKSVPEHSDGASIIIPQTYWLSGSPRLSKDGEKVEVINIFGETTYIPKENAKTNTVPESMSWFKGNFRVSFDGEKDIIHLLKRYLNIPNRTYQKGNGETVEIDNVKNAFIMLDNIKDYFSGNFKEIKDVVAMGKDNKVKVLVGLKTNDNNKTYYHVFKEYVMNFASRRTDLLCKNVKDALSYGRYKNVDFGVEPYNFVIHEDKPSTPPTPAEQPANDNFGLPF